MGSCQIARWLFAGFASRGRETGCWLGGALAFRLAGSQPLDWSKGKVKDKAQHAVILDKQTSEKLYKDVQSFRLVTVATLVDRMKINGSLARRCIKDLEEKGLIRPVVQHSKMQIYTRAVGGTD
ncbi:40S ribosomal protein S25 [Verticillium alfalfae VaMs.102]|uniref:40S ribosomal protein S25 n=1 Tax=Verticillium alfalfae (strain VaMs.102 / ATCC MYA-4576 / FGSC 10136) TaxID=526221 RepID=C9SLB5_VERA1|nr:40S ribosomal protein S25 [Verticillium alfalfae VaMs.102]EEY19483.1 40S ribosomal protein S25 [Verticillium alfalfae VaMs.102]